MIRMSFLSLIFFSLFSSCFFERDSTAERKFLPPLMGWSSWNTYHVHISDSLIMRQADALIANGLKEMGYQYINIDDGFFGGRDSEGRMLYNAKRFPNGMRVVSDYIHSLGLRAGIYAEAGHNTCGSIYDADSAGVGSGLYGHEQQDIDLLIKDWNFDFIKIDYCGGRVLGLDECEQYTKIVDAIRNTGRTDVSINICRWAFPGVWAHGLARSWRISPDIRPRWSSLKNIIEKNLYLSAYAGEGHYNDMDMLEVGRGFTSDEEVLHFGMWCMMSSPLLIGCDMTSIPEASLALLKNEELIALNQDPLGLQAYVVQRPQKDCYVLVKDVEVLRGKTRAVALLNMSDSVASFQIPLCEVELSGDVKVRDLVARQEQPAICEELKADLPPHSVKILRLEGEKRNEPQRYEAEWAWLNQYDDLGKRSTPVCYIQDEACSGGVKVIHLGGSPDNYAEWRNVYSEKGGTYELTLRYKADVTSKAELLVNGKAYGLELQASEGDACTEQVVTVELNPGNNVVRLVSAEALLPEFDCFYLQDHRREK